MRNAPKSEIVRWQ